MSESLFQFEYHPGDEVVLRFKSPRHLVPGATHGHLRAATREMLLALRDMVDMAIEKTEPESEEKKTTRIEVQ